MIKGHETLCAVKDNSHFCGAPGGASSKDEQHYYSKQSTCGTPCISKRESCDKGLQRSVSVGLPGVHTWSVYKNALNMHPNCKP